MTAAVVCSKLSQQNMCRLKTEVKMRHQATRRRWRKGSKSRPIRP
jgi:hypothetical protein